MSSTGWSGSPRRATLDRMEQAPQGPDSDPTTGEPRRGVLGLYQRLEDLMGQGAVACLLIFFGFMVFAVWQIVSLS